MIQPKTEKGRAFLLALRELMREHDIARITGEENGESWLMFNQDMSHDVIDNYVEPDLFDLSVENLEKL